MKKLILTFLTLYSLCHSITFAATFEQWKKSYAKEASKRGIPSSFTLKVLKDVKLDQTVIDKDRNQVILSETKDYNEFMKRWLRDDNERIKRAKLEYERNLPLLEKVEKRFGVDKEWGSIPDEKLNVNGGGIALGHPVGSTGCRIIVTAAHELKKRNGKYALASLCIGGGQGGACIIENL